MKKLIIHLLALLLIYSCSATKKLTKIDTHTESELVIEFKDSSVIHSSWDIFLENLEKTVDLSTIHIISYYPIKDSATGDQLIKDEVKINKNIVTTTEAEITNKGEVSESFEVEINSAEKVKTDVKEEILQKKGSSKFKLYIVIIVLITISIGAIYFVFKS